MKRPPFVDVPITEHTLRERARYRAWRQTKRAIKVPGHASRVFEGSRTSDTGWPARKLTRAEKTRAKKLQKKTLDTRSAVC